MVLKKSTSTSSITAKLKKSLSSSNLRKSASSSSLHSLTKNSGGGTPTNLGSPAKRFLSKQEEEEDDDLFLREKEQRLIQCLEKRDVDLWKLREFAFTKGGFVNEQIRRKAWHKLVNVNPYTPPPPTSTIPNEQEDEEYELIKRDVKRSVLFRHTTTTTTITQEVQTLHIQTIHSSIHSSKESKDKKRRRHYYQGYQDLSSIFLHIYSSTPHIATLILTTLSKFHLRDAMRDTFAVFHSVIAAMTLPILQEVDEEMHDWVESSGEEEFVYSVFLRWMVTWFAHDVHDVGIVERLFDVFLSSHPLTPLYVSIAILTHPMNRQDILQSCSDMVDDEGPTIMRIQNLVSKLKQEDKTSIGAILTPQLLIEFAVGIMKQVPPRSLFTKAKRYHAQNPSSTQLLKLASASRLLKLPPSNYYSLLPSVPADWVLHQQHKQKDSTNSGGGGTKSQRRKSPTSSTTSSRTIAAAAVAAAAATTTNTYGNCAELLTPDTITNTTMKYPNAKIASGVLLDAAHSQNHHEEKQQQKAQESQSSSLLSFLSSTKSFASSNETTRNIHSKLAFGLFESVMKRLSLSVSMKRVTAQRKGYEDEGQVKEGE